MDNSNTPLELQDKHRQWFGTTALVERDHQVSETLTLLAAAVGQRVIIRGLGVQFLTLPLVAFPLPMSIVHRFLAKMLHWLKQGQHFLAEQSVNWYAFNYRLEQIQITI